jgi:hypothetical protein
MRSPVLAFFLAIAMAWMGLAAQTQAAWVTSEGLAEHVQAALIDPPLVATPASVERSGSLDDHHLDDLPIQLLADLIGLLRQPCAGAAAGLPVRPEARLAAAGPPPYLAGLRRPPIARA